MGAGLGTLATFEGPKVDIVLYLKINGPDGVPPLRAGSGLPLGAVTGLLLGAVTLLVPLGRRTALRLLRPGPRDAAWSVAAGGAVALALFLREDVTGDLLLHPDLHVPRWFLADSRAGILGSAALFTGVLTWGSRLALHARPRHARRGARLAGACALVGALLLFARS